MLKKAIFIKFITICALCEIIQKGDQAVNFSEYNAYNVTLVRNENMRGFGTSNKIKFSIRDVADTVVLTN